MKRWNVWAALRKPKDIKGNSNHLLYVVGMDGYLVVGSHQVDFGGYGTTEKLVGVVMKMPDGVAFGNGTGVEGSVIATGTPPVVFLGNDVMCRRPGALGAASCGVLQHGVELGFGDSEPIRCQSPWPADDRWPRCSPNVVDSIMVDFALDSGRPCEVPVFGEDAVDRCAVSDGLDAGGRCVGGLDRYV
jgi:hypothetical protein